MNQTPTHKHIEDTLICGDGECDAKIVKIVIEESTQRINRLIKWGTQLDENSKWKLQI